MSGGARLEAQGLLEEALDAFVAERDWNGAARVAMALGRHVDAATYLLEAQRFWDAAVCFQRGGALKECLAALVRVPATSERYRQACVHAVRVAGLLNASLDAHSAWLMPFIGKAPAAPVEAEAMKAIADAFGERGKVRLASSILKTVLSTFPADDDAKERLAALSSRPEAGATPPSMATPLPSTPSGLSRVKAKLGDALRAQGLLTPSLWERLTREQPQLVDDDVALAEAVVGLGLVKDRDVLRVRSELAGIPHVVDDDLVALVSVDAARMLTRVVSLEQAEAWRIAPFRMVERQLFVAMEDARDVALVDRLRFATRAKIVPHFATAAGIRRAVGKLYRGVDPLEESAWQGRLINPETSEMVIEPFSDRVTGTREHLFDTGEFARREALETATPQPTSARTVGVPGPVTATPFAVGSRFAERYQLEALIGSGGSASVYRATDLELDEAVAIKVFHPANEREAEILVARFKLELSLSRALSHPNIVRLFDLGSVGEWRYLTMELLEGEDLAKKLDDARGPLPLGDGLGLLEQACLGLQAAHERDVVHRDVKPQNLFVTSAGVVKVMDFGIARRRSAAGITLNGMIAGTPEYMSPEQINDFSNVTYATDLYALGVTAYQVLTGALPFEAKELTRLLLMQATEAPPPPRAKNPALPEPVANLVLQLLEKDPLKRPASAGAVAQQLRALRELALP